MDAEIIIPKTWMECPVCHCQMVADIYEYESDTGIPTTHGFHLYCHSLETKPCTRTYEQDIQLTRRAYQYMMIYCRKIPLGYEK